jgi:hypothetical protein
MHRATQPRRWRGGPIGVVVGVSVLQAGVLLATASAATANTASSRTFLAGLMTVKTLAPTTPANGDENPYSVDVAPVSAGSVHEGDVIVDNFNAKSNEQGTGSTLVDVTPNGTATLLAAIPRNLPGCPGGVGLSTAFTMLKVGGWMIVGSTPSTNGTTKTAGAGCLIELSPTGKVVGTIAGPKLDGPWDMATVDNGSTVTLFVTNTLFDVKAPGQAIQDKGTLVRIALSVTASAPPTVTSETVIASGLPEQASASAFVRGPTGVAVIGSTAYVASPLQNAIVAVPDATTRSTADTDPVTISSGGDLHQPIAMVASPENDLLVANGLDGDVVEVATSGKQLREFAIDSDPAQSPPGSGDLFGLAVAPSGKALYFAKDDTNTVAELS